jgi:hypothetical protein
MLAEQLTDSRAATLVWLTAGGLALLGLLLLIFTVWWWRGTRPEPEALAPLEVMSEKRWAKASDSERHRLVDAYRPDGAAPLRTATAAPERIDLSELARTAPDSFDDLRDDAPMVSSSLAALVSSVEAPSSDPVDEWVDEPLPVVEAAPEPSDDNEIASMAEADGDDLAGADVASDDRCDAPLDVEPDQGSDAEPVDGTVAIVLDDEPDAVRAD